MIAIKTLSEPHSAKFRFPDFVPAPYSFFLHENRYLVLAEVSGDRPTFFVNERKFESSRSKKRHFLNITKAVRRNKINEITKRGSARFDVKAILCGVIETPRQALDWVILFGTELLEKSFGDGKLYRGTN